MSTPIDGLFDEIEKTRPNIKQLFGYPPATQMQFMARPNILTTLELVKNHPNIFPDTTLVPLIGSYSNIYTVNDSYDLSTKMKLMVDGGEVTVPELAPEEETGVEEAVADVVATVDPALSGGLPEEARVVEETTTQKVLTEPTTAPPTEDATQTTETTQVVEPPVVEATNAASEPAATGAAPAPAPSPAADTKAAPPKTVSKGKGKVAVGKTELETLIEQSVQKLKAADTKIAGLERALASKETEIGELKARLEAAVGETSISPTLLNSLKEAVAKA